MATKEQLALRIISNAMQDVTEILRHANAVASLVRKSFPETIPERMLQSEVRLHETGLLGKLRAPEETVRLMRERCDRYASYEEKG